MPIYPTTIRHGDVYPCEFCAGKFSVATHTADEKYVGLVHTAPACPSFMKLDVEHFLAATNAQFLTRTTGQRS
jgi:hypothetical protein